MVHSRLTPGAPINRHLAVRRGHDTGYEAVCSSSRQQSARWMPDSKTRCRAVVASNSDFVRSSNLHEVAAIANLTFLNLEVPSAAPALMYFVLIQDNLQFHSEFTVCHITLFTYGTPAVAALSALLAPARSPQSSRTACSRDSNHRPSPAPLRSSRTPGRTFRSKPSTISQ